MRCIVPRKAAATPKLGVPPLGELRRVVNCQLRSETAILLSPPSTTERTICRVWRGRAASGFLGTSRACRWAAS